MERLQVTRSSDGNWATYNITFEWISGACNKAADCLSHLVEVLQDKPVSINVLSVTDTDGPAFSTRS